MRVEGRVAGEKEREERGKHQCERKTWMGCLPHEPQVGPEIEPEPKYEPLTGNKTGDLPVNRPML